jgi:hypothetical protein
MATSHFHSKGLRLILTQLYLFELETIDAHKTKRKMRSRAHGNGRRCAPASTGLAEPYGQNCEVQP